MLQHDICKRRRKYVQVNETKKEKKKRKDAPEKKKKERNREKMNEWKDMQKKQKNKRTEKQKKDRKTEREKNSCVGYLNQLYGQSTVKKRERGGISICLIMSGRRLSKNWHFFICFEFLELFKTLCIRKGK